MMTSTSKKMAAVVLAVTVAMSLSACSNMSKRDRNTAIGAGAGAIGGAVGLEHQPVAGRHARRDEPGVGRLVERRQRQELRRAAGERG